MYCNKCGKEINKESEFCFNCGAKTYIENYNSTKNAQLCLNCKGNGQKHSLKYFVISLIINIILFNLAIVMLFLEPSVSLLLIGIIIFILYWGCKKRECKVCRGSGKIYF